MLACLGHTYTQSQEKGRWTEATLGLRVRAIGANSLLQRHVNNNNNSRRNDEARGPLIKIVLGTQHQLHYISAVGDTATGITHALGSNGCLSICYFIWYGAKTRDCVTWDSGLPT